MPLSKTESETSTQKYDKIVILKSDTAGSKSKPMDVSNPNATDGAQLSQLKAHNEELDVAVKELKSTKARIIELDTAALERDKLLSRTEQKLTELTKELKQEKKSKELLQAELSAKNVSVAKLKEMLKVAESNVIRFKDEIQKRKKEIEKLQDQITRLKIQKTASQSPPAVVRTQEKLPTRKEAFETETEPPSPADIIDWVIKKKSEE
jgi:chromosome segregation ATPase